MRGLDQRLRLEAIGLGLLFLLAVLLTLRWTSGIGLVETDTFPLLAASRVDDLQDLLTIFARDIFGLQGKGIFYRPVVNLTFALDQALWGLNPFGYQVTNAVLFALCGTGLAVLTRRLAGPRARVALWVVPIVFLLHPSHVEVVPGAPRRQEMLCALFLMLALVSQLSWRGRPRARALAVTLLMCLAMASKEAAVLGPLLGFAVALGSEAHRSQRDRVWQATKATVPYLVAVAAMIGVRFMVTGRLGGHLPIEVAAKVLEHLPVIGQWVLGRLLDPQRMTPRYGLPLALVCTAALAALVLAIPPRRATDGQGRDEAGGSNPGRLALLGLVWVAGVIALYALTSLVQPWHTLLPVVGWSLCWGALAEKAVAAVRAPGVRSRAAGAAGLLALAGIVVWEARDCPWFVDYPEYRRLTIMSGRYLSALQGRIDATANGETIYGGSLPFWMIPPSENAATVFGATALSRYSVAAWTRVMYPDRRIRVLPGPKGYDTSPPRPDEIVVLLARIPGQGPAPKQKPPPSGVPGPPNFGTR